MNRGYRFGWRVAFMVLFAMGFPAMAQRAVLVFPAKIPAFSRIESGIREKVGDRYEVQVILASDFEGKPGGVVAAALAVEPTVVLPFGTTMSRAFLGTKDRMGMPPFVCVAVTNPTDVLPADQLVAPRTMAATIITDGPVSIYPCTADLISTLYPSAKKIATIANQSESNSMSNLDRIRQEAIRKKWSLIEKFVSGPPDVEIVAHAVLAEKPDAIWISKDRVMTTVPSRLIDLAHQARVPVFATDSGTVESFSALGTCSVSFDDLGRYVGERLLEIRDGADVRRMAVSTLEKTRVFLSRSAIQKLGVEVPQEVLANATLFGNAPHASSSNPRSSTVPWVAIIVTALVILGVAVYLLSRRGARAQRDGGAG